MNLFLTGCSGCFTKPKASPIDISKEIGLFSKSYELLLNNSYCSRNFPFK